MGILGLTLWFILLMGAILFVEGAVALLVLRPRGRERFRRQVYGIFARQSLFGGCLLATPGLLLLVQHVFPPTLAARLTSGWLITLGLLSALLWLWMLLGIRGLSRQHVSTQIPLGFLRISIFSGIGTVVLGSVLLHQGIMEAISLLLPGIEGQAIGGSLVLAELGGWVLFFLIIAALGARFNAQRDQRAVFRYRKHVARTQYFDTLSPLHILQVILSASPPPDWDVFRPRRSSPAAVMALTLLLLIPCGTGYLLALFPLLWREGTMTLLSVLSAGLLSTILALLVGGIGMRLVKREADALLVLFPEGIIEYERVSEQERHSSNVIAFACIEHIEIIKNVIIEKAVMLEFRYRTGEQATWPVGAKLGPSEQIARQIIERYRRYRESRR